MWHYSITAVCWAEPICLNSEFLIPNQVLNSASILGLPLGLEKGHKTKKRKFFGYLVLFQHNSVAIQMSVLCWQLPGSLHGINLSQLRLPPDNAAGQIGLQIMIKYLISVTDKIFFGYKGFLIQRTQICHFSLANIFTKSSRKMTNLIRICILTHLQTLFCKPAVLLLSTGCRCLVCYTWHIPSVFHAYVMGYRAWCEICCMKSVSDFASLLLQAARCAQDVILVLPPFSAALHLLSPVPQQSATHTPELWGI